ncbi:hypothetical protein L2E82_50842 [Cichorium intybus]|nr:hypothetical protein L2E82_50842 [Cichorium intybus]
MGFPVHQIPAIITASHDAIMKYNGHRTKTVTNSIMVKMIQIRFKEKPEDGVRAVTAVVLNETEERM